MRKYLESVVSDDTETWAMRQRYSDTLCPTIRTQHQALGIVFVCRDFIRLQHIWGILINDDWLSAARLFQGLAIPHIDICG